MQDFSNEWLDHSSSARIGQLEYSVCHRLGETPLDMELSYGKTHRLSLFHIT